MAESEVYNDLVQGLTEAIEHARGERVLRTMRVPIPRPQETPPEDGLRAAQ